MAKPIILTFLGDSKSLDKTFSKLSAQTKTSGSGFSKLASIGKKALEGIGGAAVAQLGLAIHAGDKLNESQDLLENALKNTGQTTDSFAGKLGPLVSQMAKWGYTNDQVNDGLAALVRAGDSATTATTDLSLAANIAKGRHIDLASAEQLLVKVRTGHVALLGRYGIATKDANGKTISITAAVGKLSKMYSGSANAASQSLAGKTLALKAQFQNLQEKIGQKLIPILLMLFNKLAGGLHWLSDHKAVAIALATVVGGTLVIAVTAYIASMVAAAAVTIVAAAPIIALVVAAAALVAGVVYLWTHWNQVWTWISHHKAYAAIIAIIFPIIPAIMAVVKIVQFLWTHWSSVWGAIQSVTKVAGNVISSVVHGVVTVVQWVATMVGNIIGGHWGKAWSQFSDFAKTAVSAVWGFISDLPGKIMRIIPAAAGALRDAGSTIIHAMWDGIKSAWNWLADHTTFKLPTFHIPGTSTDIGGGTVSLLPHLAKGGVVTGPTLAMIGERGREAVIPLSDMGRAREHAKNLGLAGGSVDNRKTYNITVPVSRDADARRIAREVAWSAKTGGY